MADHWSDHREALSAIASDIEDAEQELQDLYGMRAEAVLEASIDGMPQREIGFELGVSHTMVQKIFAGELGAPLAILADSVRTSDGAL